MKIYTRKGDDGRTALYGGGRVSKADARVEAYGSVDELNAAIGLARAASLPEGVDEVLAHVQSDLFDLGAELAAVGRAAEALGETRLTEADVARLERAIDRFDDELPPLRTFVLPGGSEAAARLHVARTVARRAERRLVQLSEQESVRPLLLQYLNRAGDLLFVLARLVNARVGVADVPWLGRGHRQASLPDEEP